MSILRIEMSDWLYNAGIVGLVNALGYSGIKESKQYIEIDSENLNGFEEKYFNYLIKQYEIFTSYHKIVNFKDRAEAILNQDEYSDEDIKRVLEEINSYIEFLKQKLVSNSYISAYINIKKDINKKNCEENEEKYDYLDLPILSKKLKKITKSKKQTTQDVIIQMKDQMCNILEIIEYVEKKEVKRHLLAKDLTYMVIQNFWSNRSFLHKTKNKANVFEEYKNYFLNPILDKIKEDGKKSKYKKEKIIKDICFNCGVELMEVNKSHNLTWLKHIGVDGEKKASHFWNLERIDTICPVCNLVYSCIPLGFVYLKEQGLFINNNSSVRDLLNSNKHVLKENNRIIDLEYKSYLTIANSFTKYNIENMSDSSKRIKNIQIVKLDIGSVSPYSFNILNKEMIRLLIDNAKRLDFLLDKKIEWYIDKQSRKHYKDLYKEVIDSIYHGKNLFDLVNFILMKKIRGSHINLNTIHNLLVINKNFLEKQGVVCMQEMNEKKIYAIRCKGYELKKAYENRQLNNKVTTILNKLSNCLHIKNVDKFLDTIIDSYGYIGKEVPNVFIECLNNRNLFLTVGYAFVLGLAGEDIKILDNSGKDKKVNEGVGINE